MNRRLYFCHPAALPLRYQRCPETGSPTKTLKVGLCFSCREWLAPGTILEVTIPVDGDPQRFRTKVLKCRKDKCFYRVYVGLLSEEDAFRARMTEQLLCIEAYRAQVWKREGRILSSENAAREWIPQFADNFPAVHQGDLW